MTRRRHIRIREITEDSEERIVIVGGRGGRAKCREDSQVSIREPISQVLITPTSLSL